jgi:hypothetical protein
MVGSLSQIGFHRMRQEDAGAKCCNKSGYQFKHWKSPCTAPGIGLQYSSRVSGWFRGVREMVSFHSPWGKHHGVEPIRQSAICLLPELLPN